MAKASPQATFNREFRGHIERFTSALVTALRKILTAKLPPVVKVLAFEIDADWREFPVSVFAMDDEAPNEVYFKRQQSGYTEKDHADSRHI